MSSFRTVARIAAVAAAIVVPAAAQAQSFGRAAERTRPAVITQEDIVAAEAIGEGFAISGQFVEARQAYQKAALLRQKVKESPAAAQRQIANLYYAEGNLLSAARTLDALAHGAARRGEHDVRAAALLEATFLYRAAGERRRSDEIARELRALRADRSLAADLEAEIAQRIG